MKLNNKRTILVGLAFLSICAFWQMYDNVVPLILTKTFKLNETFSGAVMAAGLCCRYTDSSDLAAKEKIAALARELTGRFQAKYGALRCAEIKIDTAHCNEYIAFMAEQAEDVIKQFNKNGNTGE